MIVTEQEARELWCPAARVETHTAVASTNRGETRDRTYVRQAVACIGSRCMAWRWSDTATPARPVLLSHSGRRPPDDDPRWRADTAGGVDDESVAGIELHEAQARTDGEDPSGWRYTWRIFGDAPDRRGFCGLAYSVRLP
jgi:hypothetical protein